MVYNLVLVMVAYYTPTIFAGAIQNNVLKVVLDITCVIAFVFFMTMASKEEKELLKRIKRIENKQNEYILMKDLKEGRTMYDFKTVKGHIEVYYNGEFLCTADNMDEAMKDAEAHSKGEL